MTEENFETPEVFHVRLNLQMAKGNISKSEFPKAVYVNIRNWLAENQQHDFYKDFKNFTDEDGNLIPEKVNLWFMGLVKRHSQEFSEQSTYNIKYETFKIIWSPGPTFKVILEYGPKLFIKLVPSFLCSKDEWIFEKLSLSTEKVIKQNFGNFFSWNIVPTSFRDERAFEASFSTMESHILTARSPMKDFLRLIKQMNKKCDLSLDSYEIKNIFLWIDEEKGGYTFWSQSTFNIVHAILEKMITVYRKKHLPHFWDHSVNLLHDMKGAGRGSILRQLKDIQERLEFGNKFSVATIFLSEGVVNKYFM